jgi:AcrR family transcriptional regulator
MSRWEPNARERLQHAAMELFHERGYDAVTVVEIAERAGLTRRSFFNHFTDKRDVPFAGADDLQADALRALEESDQDREPFSALLKALTIAGLRLADYIDVARLRLDLIASSPDLQERNLVKLATLARVLAQHLVEQGEDPAPAHFAGQAAVAVFDAAYECWARDPSADFTHLMQRSAAELRQAVGASERPTRLHTA